MLSLRECTIFAAVAFVGAVMKDPVTNMLTEGSNFSTRKVSLSFDGEPFITTEDLREHGITIAGKPILQTSDATPLFVNRARPQECQDILKRHGHELRHTFTQAKEAFPHLDELEIFKGSRFWNQRVCSYKFQAEPK